MNLDADLQRILNIGAKVYNTTNNKQGKVIDVSDRVHIEYTDNQRDIFEEDEFKKMLVDDIIVANYRLTMGSGNKFKVIPREGQPNVSRQSNNPPSIKRTKVTDQPKEPKLEVGYINFKTGKFSTESKRGYTKVEYRKATTKIELEIDEDQLRKLKEMGLV